MKFKKKPLFGVVFLCFYLDKIIILCIKLIYICHMEYLCKIITYVFILFLSTPTIISFVEGDVDTSSFYNLSEEEHTNNAFSEIKTIPANYSIPLIIDFEGFQKVKFSVFNETKINSIKPNVFLQPPELA